MHIQLLLVLSVLGILISFEMLAFQIKHFPEEVYSFENVKSALHKLGICIKSLFTTQQKKQNITFKVIEKVVLCFSYTFVVLGTTLFFFGTSPSAYNEAQAINPFRSQKYVNREYQAADFPSKISEVVYNTAFEAESYLFHSPDSIGEVVKDGLASGGSALFANVNSNKGYIAQSTENNIQPEGDYKILFHLKIPKNTKGNIPIAVIEAFDTQENTFLAQREITAEDFSQPGKFEEFELEFSKNSIGNTQYRVLFMGISDMWFDKVTILPQFENWVIYNPNIYYDNAVEEGSNSDIVREALSERDLRGFAVFHIQETPLPNGEYTAKFRLKTKNNLINRPIGKIIIQDNGPKSQYFSKVVFGKDFVSTSDFQEFELDFLATKESKIDYRVFFFDIPQSDLYIDTISIENK